MTFLGREKMKQELAQNGLALSDPEGFSVRFEPDRIRFETKPAVLRKADIILLCVKSTGTEAAAKEIARSARGGATVISFQNGVSNADTLRRRLPRQNVIQGMVPYNVVRLGPGRWHRATWGDLTAEDAAEAKWWCTEMQQRVTSGCLQLFGGYGFMTEYPIARAFCDARVQTIYGGTTEIMKEIIGKAMKLES